MALPARAGRPEAVPPLPKEEVRGKTIEITSGGPPGGPPPPPERPEVTAEDPREAIRREIIDRYLWPEEIQSVERGERPHRAEEAAQLREWLRSVDVEQTYRDDDYYAQHFGDEFGFTRLSRSKDGEELKHAFIERVVLEKEAKLRGTDSAMQILGIARMADGSLRFHGGDRPHEQGDPIDQLVAHALITGYETAMWLKDPKQRQEARARIVRDSYRLLGRVPDIEINLDDLIETQELVGPEPGPEDVRRAMSAEEAALRRRLAQIQKERDALLADSKASDWMRKQITEQYGRDIAELEQRLAQLQQREAAPETTGADDEEAARLRGRIENMRKQLAVNEQNPILSESMRESLRQKIEADIVALEAEIAKRQGARAPGKPEFPAEGIEITFDELETAPVSPTLSPEAVKTARDAYATEAKKPSRWERLTKVMGGALRGMWDEARHFGRSLMDARWWKERAKTVLSAGVLDLHHFFKYGRAARVEAKAIEGAYDSLRAEVGLAPEALEARIKNVVDEAEGRLMKRLVTYKDEFGAWVMEKERLDTFREEVATRIRDRYKAEQDFDRKGMRDAILKTMDPGWYRRGRWGIMGLGLAANGLALALSKLGPTPVGPERWAVGPPKAPAGPEGTLTLGPIEQITGMKGTAWDTVKHFVRNLKPDASSEEMVATIRKVLEHNGIYEPHSGLWPTADHLQAVTEGAKALGRTLIDAHKMPDGFPLRIPVDEIRTILGIGAKGAGAVA